MWYYFLHKDKCITRFSFLHDCNFKVGPWPFKKNFYLLQWKPFKIDEKCCLFHLKSFLRSQDIYIFVLIFGYWGKDTSSTPSSFCFSRGKSKWSAAQLVYTLIVLHLAYNKNKLHKSLDYWSRYILNFDFVEKGQGIVSTSHFMYDFSRKMYLMLCWLF